VAGIIRGALALGVAGLAFPLTAMAKTAFSPGPFPFTPIHRAAGLKYPPLPAETLERIRTGRRRPTPAPKLDSAISRDWALASIGFFEVFSPLVQPLRPSMEPCSPEIVVAVVDTGIDYTHPELRSSLWVNPGESGPWEPPKGWKQAANVACRDRSCNGIDDDTNGFIDDVVGWDFVHDVPLPFDTHGHGTHIAGIIASSSANGIGTAGVCPRVSVMPLKYYDNSGSGYNNLANTVRAMQYAVRNGAQIINYSGGGADPATAERTSIEEALRKGILVVAAAGNDGHNNDQVPYYPASYNLENIVGVGSLNKQQVLLPSSNYGRTVHVAAPGLSILSTLPESKYGTMSGTSQATAFVTGTAALLASQMRGHGLDFRQIKRWIVDSARSLQGNTRHQYLSAGILSLPRALQAQKDWMKKMYPTGPQPAPPTGELALRPGGETVPIPR